MSSAVVAAEAVVTSAGQDRCGVEVEAQVTPLVVSTELSENHPAQFPSLVECLAQDTVVLRHPEWRSFRNLSSTRAR